MGDIACEATTVTGRVISPAYTKHKVREHHTWADSLFHISVHIFQQGASEKKQIGEGELCSRSLLLRKCILLLPVRKFDLQASDLTSKKKGTFFLELKL